jgi:hypothetical protein
LIEIASGVGTPMINEDATKKRASGEDIDLSKRILCGT